MPKKTPAKKTRKLTAYLGSEIIKGSSVASESSSHQTPARSLAPSPVLEVYSRGDLSKHWVGGVPPPSEGLNYFWRVNLTLVGGIYRAIP